MYDILLTPINMMYDILLTPINIHRQNLETEFTEGPALWNLRVKRATWFASGNGAT